MSMKFLRKIALCFCLVISGCEAVVYSNLSEQEANDMTSVLYSNGIKTERRQVDDMFNILVDEANLPLAISLLKANGFPKAKFASLGDIFGGDELIRTPFHEHARFVHATSQELARSISEVEGVLSARVHVMLPEKSAISKKRSNKSSAAVFVYTDSPGLGSSLPPIIKTLVSHSIDGLNYDGVAVAVFDNMKNTNIAQQKNLENYGVNNVVPSKLMSISNANANTITHQPASNLLQFASMQLSTSIRLGLLILVFICVAVGVFNQIRKFNRAS